MDGSCTIAGCKQAAACSLGGRVYCRDHIVAAGYEHLDSISAQLKAGKHKSTEHSEEMSRSLNRIFGELTAYCMEAGGLSHMERAQLLDLLLMAGELHRRLRREPRQLASVAVRISYRHAGRELEEEARTRELSRHGASLNCRCPLETGDSVQIERLDNHTHARARVAWRGPDEGGVRRIGLEILDQENFWNLEESK